MQKYPNIGAIIYLFPLALAQIRKTPLRCLKMSPKSVLKKCQTRQIVQGDAEGKLLNENGFIEENTQGNSRAENTAEFTNQEQLCLEIKNVAFKLENCETWSNEYSQHFFLQRQSTQQCLLSCSVLFLCNDTDELPIRKLLCYDRKDKMNAARKTFFHILLCSYYYLLPIQFL